MGLRKAAPRPRPAELAATRLSSNCGVRMQVNFQPPFSMDIAFASGLGGHNTVSRAAMQMSKLMGPRRGEVLDSKVAEFDRRCSPAACMPPAPTRFRTMHDSWQRHPCRPTYSAAVNYSCMYHLPVRVGMCRGRWRSRLCPGSPVPRPSDHPPAAIVSTATWRCFAVPASSSP